MAGQEKKQQSQTMNRRINFLVMRKMWQKIRGRAKKNSGNRETIYQAFGMSRERYTRAINGEKIRFSQKELKELVERTGVSAEIFQGKTYFQFDAISQQDWEKLFKLRDTDMKQARIYEHNLYEQMQKSDMDIVRNPDLYRFAVYVQSMAPVTDLRLEREMQETIDWMKKTSVRKLERCEPGILQEYLSELEKQMDIVRTLVHYRELKQESETKK